MGPRLFTMEYRSGYTIGYFLVWLQECQALWDREPWPKHCITGSFKLFWDSSKVASGKVIALVVSFIIFGGILLGFPKPWKAVPLWRQPYLAITIIVWYLDQLLPSPEIGISGVFTGLRTMEVSQKLNGQNISKVGGAGFPIISLGFLPHCGTRASWRSMSPSSRADLQTGTLLIPLSSVGLDRTAPGLVSGWRSD